MTIYCFHFFVLDTTNILQIKLNQYNWLLQTKCAGINADVLYHHIGVNQSEISD